MIGRKDVGPVLWLGMAEVPFHKRLTRREPGLVRWPAANISSTGGIVRNMAREARNVKMFRCNVVLHFHLLGVPDTPAIIPLN